MPAMCAGGRSCKAFACLLIIGTQPPDIFAVVLPGCFARLCANTAYAKYVVGEFVRMFACS